MNSERKDEIKRNVTTGMSTAAGAAVGSVAGAAVAPATAEAHEAVIVEPTPQPAPQPEPEIAPAPQPVPEPEPEPEPQPAPAPRPAPQPAPAPEPQPEPEPAEIEVVSYDRVTADDGSRMDVAVVSVDGREVGFIDADLDGEADLAVCDVNGNGVIEENEVEVVHGQGLAMRPLADAAGFSPELAQNDLPDYVNDADVDTYMV